MKRKPTRIRFAKRRLEALRPPDRGRLYVYDLAVPHLALAVTPAGGKAFYWYKFVDGRPVRCRLGALGEMSVEQARREATRLNAEAAEGRNPQDARRAKREEPTFGEVFAQYVDEYAKVHKRTWKADVEMYDRHLKPLANRRISTITQADLERIKVQVGGLQGCKSPYSANRLLALISVVFNKATPSGVPNPALDVERFPEQERERHMTKDEIKRFFVALDDEADPWADLFGLAIFTGARRGNLFAMRWDNVDLDTQKWTVPAAESKNAKPLAVALSEPAAEILRRRKASNGHGAFVFPSAASASGHIEDSRKAWSRVVKRAGLVDLRVHDLRRSLASVMIAKGISLYVIGKVLGHLSLKSTQVYARLDFAPQLEAAEIAGETIQEIVGNRPLALPAAEGPDAGAER